MSVMFILMNHELVQSQKEDALKTLKIDSFVLPPKNLQNLWEQIPPDKENIADIIEPILKWLANHSNQGDYILVHGDFGATFIIVSWALQHKRIPVYSTTYRKYENKTNENGEVVNVHTFKHVMFRRYRML